MQGKSSLLFIGPSKCDRDAEYASCSGAAISIPPNDCFNNNLHHALELERTSAGVLDPGILSNGHIGKAFRVGPRKRREMMLPPRRKAERVEGMLNAVLVSRVENSVFAGHRPAPARHRGSFCSPLARSMRKVGPEKSIRRPALS